MSHEFWTRWKQEYLPILNKQAIWRRGADNFKEGELVLLNDDITFQKRGKLPLARIVKVKPVSD